MPGSRSAAARSMQNSDERSPILLRGRWHIQRKSAGHATDAQGVAVSPRLRATRHSHAKARPARSSPPPPQERRAHRQPHQQRCAKRSMHEQTQRPTRLYSATTLGLNSRKTLHASPLRRVLEQINMFTGHRGLRQSIRKCKAFSYQRENKKERDLVKLDCRFLFCLSRSFSLPLACQFQLASLSVA